MSKEFKIGDKVVCTKGYGTVFSVDKDTRYPVVVDLDADGGTERFTEEGLRYRFDIFPSLFHVDKKPETWEIEKKLTMYAVMTGNKIHCTVDTLQSAYDIAIRGQRIVELTGKYTI